MDISLAIFSPDGEQPIKILVVDDDEDNLILITYQLFQLLDCSVLSAKDGRAALSIAQSSQPDLVLLDMMMPELDGFEVARRLKQDPRTQEMPIVAVTAMARLQDQEMALQAGCDGLLLKPYELEQLRDLLAHYLGPRYLFSTESIG